ncbi:HD family phosphohydrolase [Lewinellaceae bacterium SD302]|nr:HD family phosphohydrolase [Lewinellaceae bacterium SD302]
METQTSSYQEVIRRASSFVEQYINDNIGPRFVFHNFQHTYAVVKALHEIVEHFELSEREKFVLELSAWFHDVGYKDGWEGHEERGAAQAKNFLDRQEESFTPETYEQVRGCIMATSMPHDPQNLLERIVCDADLSHLGESSYWDRCGRVRQEFALTRDMIMSDQEWIDFELNFMLGHDYQTEAAREIYGDRKDRHVKQLFKRKRQLFPDQTPTNLKELKEKKKESKKGKKKAKKEDKEKAELTQLKLSRGVETMYRATYRTHVNLSSIADNKANIMLSVNAIILSILAANLFPKLDSNPHLTIPSIILIGVCLGSLFYAIQATRPKVTEGKVTREDIDGRRSNLLFFGNFYNMKIEDFHYGMMEMIRDDEFLYSSMTRDLYYLGVVLAKKYRFLRVCYNIFLFGLMIAVSAFIVAAVYHNATAPQPVGSSGMGLDLLLPD